MSSRPARKRRRHREQLAGKDVLDYAYGEASAFRPPSFGLLPRPPAVQAKIDKLGAVISEQRRKFAEWYFKVPSPAEQATREARWKAFFEQVSAACLKASGQPFTVELAPALPVDDVVYFERGPMLGVDELFACGAIGKAFYDEHKAAPPLPPVTLVVKSVDRDRGILTFGLPEPAIEDALRAGLAKAGKEGTRPPAAESIYMSAEVEAQLRKALL